MTVVEAEANVTRAHAALSAPLTIKTAQPMPNVLGRIGSLETRLARNEAEIIAAQRIRYSIFAEEMGAKLDLKAQMSGLDSDRFDLVCDHLVVIDTAIEGSSENQIVGTYRLLRQDVAEKTGGFYSESEFEVEALVGRHPDLRFMELGRSCVLPQYRTRRTVELLWQGNWAYALAHEIDVMFGCASFPGAIPAEHALALSFLYHNCRADGDWTTKAKPDRACSMDWMPSEAANPKLSLAAMPPLMKGYLRLGAKFGENAVIDEEFGTTDVLVILPVRTISGRYISHYGADAGRFSS